MQQAVSLPKQNGLPHVERALSMSACEPGICCLGSVKYGPAWLLTCRLWGFADMSMDPGIELQACQFG